MAKKSIYRLFPHPKEGRFFLYVIGLKDGQIKIGQTSDPRTRIDGHRRQFGLAWCHLFPSGSRRYASVTETAGIKIFSGFGQRIGRTERFTGIDKATAIQALRVIVAEAQAYERKWAEHDFAKAKEACAWMAFRAQWHDANSAASPHSA